MYRTTDGLEGVFAYIDDSQVGSPDKQTYLRHLVAFFTALAANSLAINLEKCVFATPSLEILGHRISATGVAPTADHAAKIENCPPPSGHKTIAMFPWHGKLLPPFFAQLCTSLKPLTNLLKGGAKTLAWTVSAQEAFQNAKRLLAVAVPLQHPAPNAEHSLATDASDTHIRGVMQQKSGDHWRPLGFLSCSNQTTAGSVAATSAVDPVDFEEMAAEQNRCPETQRLLGGTSLKLAFHQTGAQPLSGEVSTGNFRPIVPLNSEKPFFIIFTMLLTPGGLPPGILFHLGLCGAVFPAMSLPGPASVWPASRARSTATHPWSPNSSPSPNGIFLTSMLIWWALCSTVIILITFLLLLIIRPMDGSYPSFRNVCSGTRKSFRFYLDFSFWSARNDHF